MISRICMKMRPSTERVNERIMVKISIILSSRLLFIYFQRVEWHRSLSACCLRTSNWTLLDQSFPREVFVMSHLNAIIAAEGADCELYGSYRSVGTRNANSCLWNLETTEEDCWLWWGKRPRYSNTGTPTWGVITSLSLIFLCYSFIK